MFYEYESFEFKHEYCANVWYCEIEGDNEYIGQFRISIFFITIFKMNMNNLSFLCK